MSITIGIFGCAGMARETHDVADALGHDVIYIARNAAERDSFETDGKVVLESDVEQFENLPCVIGIGDGAARRAIAQKFAGKIDFINLIHPSANFGRGQLQRVETRQGVIVCAGVQFTSEILVGDFTIFNLNATVSHDTIIEDFVTVSPQACLLGNTHIETGAWIGAGAIVNNGDSQSKTRIGANTLIGSGAVVTKDCDANGVYIGVPARRIK